VGDVAAADKLYPQEGEGTDVAGSYYLCPESPLPTAAQRQPLQWIMALSAVHALALNFGFCDK